MKLYYFDENDEEYKEYIPAGSRPCMKCAKYYFNNGQCFGNWLNNNCDNFVPYNLKTNFVPDDLKTNFVPDKKGDNVEHPSHYKGTDSLECIDVIQFSFGIDGFVYYCAGNVFKYLWRYNNKNGTEDIKKAKQYLDIMGDLSTHMSAQAYDIYSRSQWLYKRSVEHDF